MFRAGIFGVGDPEVNAGDFTPNAGDFTPNAGDFTPNAGDFMFRGGVSDSLSEDISWMEGSGLVLVVVVFVGSVSVSSLLLFDVARVLGSVSESV